MLVDKDKIEPRSRSVFDDRWQSTFWSYSLNFGRGKASPVPVLNGRRRRRSVKGVGGRGQGAASPSRRFRRQSGDHDGVDQLDLLVKVLADMSVVLPLEAASRSKRKRLSTIHSRVCAEYMARKQLLREGEYAQRLPITAGRLADSSGYVMLYRWVCCCPDEITSRHRRLVKSSVAADTPLALLKGIVQRKLTRL